MVAANGHGGLPDRDLLKDLLPIVRQSHPKRLDWCLTDQHCQRSLQASRWRTEARNQNLGSDRRQWGHRAVFSCAGQVVA